MQVRSSSKWFTALFGAFAALALAACSGNAEEAGTVPGSGEDAAVEDAATIPVMGPEMRIVAFGDSLFAGYGLKDSDGDSYPSKLEGALRAQGVNAVMVNGAVSGDTSAAGRQRIAFLLDAQEEKPDLFILELGGNDFLRGISASETRANFEAMLGELKSRDIPVLIMGMRAPPNLGQEYQAEFDALYGDLAEKYGAAIIPFWLEDIFEDPTLFQDDRIHPTEEGIEKLVDSTLDQVKAALPEPDEEA